MKSCPYCGYPDTKDGQHFKGIYDPSKPCGYCGLAPAKSTHAEGVIDLLRTLQARLSDMGEEKIAAIIPLLPPEATVAFLELMQTDFDAPSLAVLSGDLISRMALLDKLASERAQHEKTLHGQMGAVDVFVRVGVIVREMPTSSDGKPAAVARGGVEEHVLNSLSKSWEGMVQMMARQHEALLHRNAELEKACDKLMEHCRASDDECDRQRRIIDKLTATTEGGK